MFSLPLPSRKRSATNISFSRQRSRKRRSPRTPAQQRASFTAQITKSHTSSPRTVSPGNTSSLAAVLTPDEIYQYSVAGLSVEDERPKHPFPHGPDPNSDGPAKLDYDLRRRLDPSSALAKGEENPSATVSLHQQHLAAMMAILHRSLLEEDFVRANRAFGMILRDDAGGEPNDIRLQGNWGIGAEILLRQNAHREQSCKSQSGAATDEERSITREPARAFFTRKGFEDARKYYSRLIVQYPFRRQTPTTICALDFYPAMFGVWIYVAHYASKVKASDIFSIDGSSDSDGDWPQAKSASPIVQLSTAQKLVGEELSQAEEIAGQMDSVMRSLPYKEYSELIRLREMVRLWVRDLEETLPKCETTGSGKYLRFDSNQ